MTTDKVIWSQGMFLQPQHLQQQDRYLENLILERSRLLNGYDWGIAELTIDKQLLSLGKLVLKSCRAILPDGTLVDIPARDKAPQPIDIPTNTQNSLVFLGLPLKRAGVCEVSLLPQNVDQSHRYQLETIEAADSNAASPTIAHLQVGKPKLRLLLEHQERQELSCLGLLRILAVKQDKTIVLDEQYLPPCLNVHASPELSGLLTEIQELLHYRGNKLKERLKKSTRDTIADFAEWLLLQIINRFEASFKHFAQLSSVHPQPIFHYCLQLLSELSTYTEWQNRAVVMPNYLHEDLQNSFQPLITQLRQSLSQVLAESAIAIPIAAQEANLWVAVIHDKSLLDKTSFILAVHADMPEQNLQIQFPAQIKVSPVEMIRSLVNRALPGIELNLLSVSPRQIPYYANFIYFSINRYHALWSQLKQSAGLAFHVGGDFPKLHLELWSIKDKSDE